MRIALNYFGSKRWGGGDFFLEGLLQGLRALGPACPHLTLVVAPDTPAALYAGHVSLVDQVLRAPQRPPDHRLQLHLSLRYHAVWWLQRRLLRRLPLARPDPLIAFLLENQIDVLFAMARSEAALAGMPSVHWLPDFQHLHLPHLFTAGELAQRNMVFHSYAAEATRILVTAEAVAADLRAFAPAHHAKARVVNFVAPVPAEVYAAEPAATAGQYHLPERFIYLPNQFWQHKNHRLVFQALALLQARGVYPCVVCTGNVLDYRQPEFFSELIQLVSRHNLREQVIILGHVPRSDVFQLMRQSVCVLNPSQFEGLGMSLAESHSLGKPVLASDLGPLREQAVPGAMFFSPDSASELAARLEEAWCAWPAGPNLPLEAAARAALPTRQAYFGRALLAVFEEARASYQPAPSRRGSR